MKDGLIDISGNVSIVPHVSDFRSGSVNSIHVAAAVFILQTGIWTELYKIEDTFIKPLRVGVNMSRAHYERELHNTMETKRGKAKGQTVDRSYLDTHFSQKNKITTSKSINICIGYVAV